MYTLIQCPLNETLIYLILVTQFEAIVSARSFYIIIEAYTIRWREVQFTHADIAINV